jgi:hypothetical protein
MAGANRTLRRIWATTPQSLGWGRRLAELIPTTNQLLSLQRVTSYLTGGCAFGQCASQWQRLKHETVHLFFFFLPQQMTAYVGWPAGKCANHQTSLSPVSCESPDCNAGAMKNIHYTSNTPLA